MQIDFPVSETWAQFYEEQGFEVPEEKIVNVRREERLRYRPDPDAIKERITRERETQDTIISLQKQTNRLLYLISKRMQEKPGPTGPAHPSKKKESKKKEVTAISWKSSESPADILSGTEISF